jgi:hypothetical protein
MKYTFASAAVLAAIVLVLAFRPASALTSHTETDCSGGSGPCISAVNSPGGIGLQGVSNGGTAGTGIIAMRTGTGGSALQALHGAGIGMFAQGNPAVQAHFAASGLSLLYQGLGPSGSVFKVDSNGNATFKGKVVGAHESIQGTASGQAVTTYGSASTVPMIEDFGEMPLVAGRGAVRFDARFASVMQSSRYLVFVTPQGPVAGTLYVTQKTPYGFVVRETAPGRSNVAVDYRIVVQPFGAAQERLPIAPAP